MVPRQSAVVTLLVVFSCQLCCGEVHETDAAATQSRHAAGLRRNPVKRHAVEKLPNRQKRLSPSIVFVSQTEWRTTGSRCVGSCYGHTDGSYQSCVACNGYATCTDGKINYNVPCEVPLMWDDLTNSCQTTTTTCRVVIGYSPCKSSPCKNGAVCNSTGDGEKDYVCTCKEGYVGTNCEGNSPCKSSPCKNGGVCNSKVDGGKEYVCTCKEGYIGTNCEDVLGRDGISTATKVAAGVGVGALAVGVAAGAVYVSSAGAAGGAAATTAGHAGIGQIGMSDVVSDVVSEVVLSLTRNSAKENDKDKDDQDYNEESETDPLLPLPYWPF